MACPMSVALMSCDVLARRASTLDATGAVRDREEHRERDADQERHRSGRPAEHAALQRRISSAGGQRLEELRAHDADAEQRRSRPGR